MEEREVDMRMVILNRTFSQTTVTEYRSWCGLMKRETVTRSFTITTGDPEDDVNETIQFSREGDEFLHLVHEALGATCGECTYIMQTPAIVHGS